MVSIVRQMNALGDPMMKVRKLTAFAILFSTASGYAGEFTYIKLKPQFEEYLTKPRLKSMPKARMLNAPMAKSLVPDSQVVEESTISEYEQKIRKALLGSGAGGPYTTPIALDGEESPLYQEIRMQMQGSHMQIGQEQVNVINQINSKFDLGSTNFSGFSWQKPYGAVHLYADRQVTPPLMTDDWMVRDTLTFQIEATTFLEKLNEAGVTNMSDVEIGAFAGVTFKRVITYDHFAKSYSEGLQSDFSKLFMSFLKFNQKGIEEMSPNDFLKKEDRWTAKAGAVVTTPPLYNISFSAGVLAEADFQKIVTIGSQPVLNDASQRYTLSINSKKSISAEVTAQLQLDFFKILNFTLLRYDLAYQYADAKEINLAFTAKEWTTATTDGEKNTELKKLLNGVGDVKVLEPYVANLANSNSQALTTRGSFLIWGNMKKTNTEINRIIKDNVVNIGFKTFSESVILVQDFWSRIYSAIIYKIFMLPVNAMNVSLYSKQFNMEYKATHPQAIDPKIIRINGPEEFSFNLIHSYQAASTHRSKDKRYKNDVIWFVNEFTTLSPEILAGIKKDTIRGPMVLESTVRVEQEGFKHILAIEDNTLYGILADICYLKDKSEWIAEAKRKELLKSNRSGKDGCVQDLGVLHAQFKSDYSANHLQPSLVKFKSFMSQVMKKAENVAHLKNLFGIQNVFHHGRIQATHSGVGYVTTFSNGQFRGLGVIDSMKRDALVRAPATIGE
jgi:hypothetical protein